jgi:ABC-type phosphate/phosphonate transport system substrate-binding protein
MTLLRPISASPWYLMAPHALALGVLLTCWASPVPGQQKASGVLEIGTSGSLGAQPAGKDSSAMEMLESFIKEETGLKVDVQRQKDWRELADKLSKGAIQLGVFQGYEFAWARHSHPDLRPLALAINVHPYLVAYVVTRNDGPARDFAGLQGQSRALPATSQPFIRLYVAGKTRPLGKDPERFFSKITTPESAQDALDDVVDGVVQATVVDRAALEAYRQQKPVRFKRLKEVARSQPFPPPLVAYKEGALDQATLRRFRDGLLNANRKEKGQTVLSLFQLTGFIVPPADFDKALAEIEKAYPPTLLAKK